MGYVYGDSTSGQRALYEVGMTGIPIVNVGPGGKMNVEEDFPKQTDILRRMAERAGAMGVTLCCKAHVGNVIYNTPMTLRAMETIISGPGLMPRTCWRWPV